MSNPSAVPLTLPGSASAAGTPVSAGKPVLGHRPTKDGKGVGKVSADAPRAPFCVGEVPRACWCCIEVAFNHPTPDPESVAEALGYAVPDEVAPEDFAARHGFGNLYADAETLAAIVRRFDALEGKGRGVCITRDHASFNDDPDTRAAGWIRQLAAEGGQLWAWVEWTPWGHAMMNGGEYVCFSTEYHYHEFTPGPKGAQPTHLIGCTVTNEPRHRGQVPCTNSDRPERPATYKSKSLAVRTTSTNPNMNTKAKNSTAPATPPADDKKPGAPGACNSEPPTEETAAANSETPPTEEVAQNSKPAKPAPAANSEPPTEETVLNAEPEAGDDPLVEIAAMLNLPNTVTPEGVIAAVGDLQRSNEELQAALAEANQNAAPATATNSVRRYPNLTMRNAARQPLNGQRPNREVNVRVGATVLAVNTQAKSKGDYCLNAVAREEKNLGRRLTPKEHAEVYGKAMRDYEAGVNR